MKTELDKMKKIIAEVKHVDVNEVFPESTFDTDMDCDSLDMYQILLKTEQEFGIKVNPSDFCGLHTVKEALMMIRQKQGM